MPTKAAMSVRLPNPTDALDDLMGLADERSLFRLDARRHRTTESVDRLAQQSHLGISFAGPSHQHDRPWEICSAEIAVPGRPGFFSQSVPSDPGVHPTKGPGSSAARCPAQKDPRFWKLILNAVV